MLIKKQMLSQIKAGQISLVFRRWLQPRVKKGSIFRTAVGVFEVLSIDEVSVADIGETDARCAGYQNRQALLASLQASSGNLYRMSIQYAGEDPRVHLRQANDLTELDFATMISKLQRYDRNAPGGGWTITVLTAIAEHPMLDAGSLAGKTGLDKEWLKRNIRKLKELGLTMSHNPGYTLSPRGEAFLRLWKAQLKEDG